MKVTVKDLLKDKKKDLSLELATGEAGLGKEITVADVNRCGLALSGFFAYFAAERVQVLGNAEVEFLKTIEPEKKKKVFKQIFSRPIPLLVLCRGFSAGKELLEAAKQYRVPVLKTPINTTRFISEITVYLEGKLAPRKKIHGVLLDVYGVGVLITGKSGVGKSECALDLVKRGHRLVADDIVEVVRASDKGLYGSPQKLLRFYLEVRGLGIVNIKELFGVGATRDRKRIEVVIDLEEWNDKKSYERIGNTEAVRELLEVKIPMICLPVKPGRNIAILIEVAAMQERLKKMGYSTMDELEKNFRLETGKREP